MLCTYRYTDKCTILGPNRNSPLTLADWTQAYAAGASPYLLLKRFAAAPTGAALDPAWIQRADTDRLLAQINALEVREAAFADRAAALAAMPLFGVPYAVKDNIDVQGWGTSAAPAGAPAKRCSRRRGEAPAA